MSPTRFAHTSAFLIVLLQVLVALDGSFLLGVTAFAPVNCQGIGFQPTIQPRQVSGQSPTALHAKAKAKPKAAKKIQVKMLHHVAGTGQAGEVVMVTPAFFQNKLRPTKLAEVISDEEVEQMKAEASAQAAETKEKASALKEKLSDFRLTIKRKAGPDHQLFGGIGPKVIMQELRDTIADDFLGEKWVKINALLDSDGKKMRGDIKHTGEFEASISLTKDAVAQFAISVEPDDN